MTFLKSNENAMEVDKSFAFAKAMGVQGVPFLVIDNKWSINGMAGESVLIQVRMDQSGHRLLKFIENFI